MSFINRVVKCEDTETRWIRLLIINDAGSEYTIVVTNVINVIYNFDKNGLSKVNYTEKVICFFSKIS